MKYFSGCLLLALILCSSGQAVTFSLQPQSCESFLISNKLLNSQIRQDTLVKWALSDFIALHKNSPAGKSVQWQGFHTCIDETTRESRPCIYVEDLEEYITKSAHCYESTSDNNLQSPNGKIVRVIATALWPKPLGDDENTYQALHAYYFDIQGRQSIENPNQAVYNIVQTGACFDNWGCSQVSWLTDAQKNSATSNLTELTSKVKTTYVQAPSCDPTPDGRTSFFDSYSWKYILEKNRSISDFYNRSLALIHVPNSTKTVGICSRFSAAPFENLNIGGQVVFGTPKQVHLKVQTPKTVIVFNSKVDLPIFYGIQIHYRYYKSFEGTQITKLDRWEVCRSKSNCDELFSN